MGKKTQILVNTAIEALYLSNPQVVSAPLGEYGGLPWLFREGAERPMDIHFENAYLGEEVLYPPFQNETMLLAPGVHLHWIVPAFLGREVDGEIPAAPNRWLVTRTRGGTDKSWLVVSDFTHEPAVENGIVQLIDDYSIFPIPRSAPERVGKPPFCYLGKKFEFNALPKETEFQKNSFKTRFGKNLTVLGFGHVQFSASYPNCKTIFGFHDPEGKINDSYSVSGWHADSQDDMLIRSIKGKFAGPDISKPDLKNYLSAQFDLDFDVDGSLPKLPEITVYQSKVKIDANPPGIDLKVLYWHSNLHISVGNNAIEAISSLLSQKMGGTVINFVVDEDQLEYMMMNEQMDGHLVDHAHKFIEERHRRGFSLSKGGSVYAFKEHRIGKTPDFEGYALVPELYDRLNELNEIQQQLNEKQNELEDEKGQLYTDWYKYMRAAYPPLGARDDFPDRDDLEMLVRFTGLKTVGLKEKEIETLESQIESKLKTLRDNFIAFIVQCIARHPKAGQTEINAKKTTVAGKETELEKATTTDEGLRISRELGAARKELEQLEIDAAVHALLQQTKQNANNPAQSYPFKQLPEKPFWEPNEPVIAIDGFSFSGRQEIKKCVITDGDFDSNNYPSGGARFPEQLLSKLSWCPFYLEWAVSLEDAPIDVNGLSSEVLKNIFFSNYYLDDDSPGIYKKDINAAKYSDNDSYFQGGTILNPYMQGVFKEKLEKYMRYCDQMITTPGANTNEWNGNKNFAQNALNHLATSDILCQRLSGFNAACLMLRQVPQLEMKEPLGFEPSLEFTKIVNETCAGGKNLSPSVMYDFLPVRNGALKITKLRFIDNFGISEDLDNPANIKPADTLCAEELRKSEDFGAAMNVAQIANRFKEVFLPPRIVQPCRLNFHFLEGENERMTDNPNVSPVIGWLIPNFLDENLMVFAADGVALGTLEKEGTWQNLPWETGQADVESKVQDKYFRKVIQQLISTENKEAGFIDAFLSAVEAALENIAPADNALHNAMALLVGRPIAVVRVETGLQIKGYAAIDQSWHSTMVDAGKVRSLPENGHLSRTERFSGNWREVELPLRLGEYRQLNDGLVGYWKEEQGQLSDIFYAPQVDVDASAGFITSRDDDARDTASQRFVHRIQADGPSHRFTVLMDPRALLHATTGILPTEAVAIPAELYEPALEKMCLWFETGPLLQYGEKLWEKTEQAEPREALLLDLPQVPEYQWKWMEKGAPGAAAGQPNLTDTQKPEFAKLYEQLPEIKNGYLLLVPKEKI